MFPRAPQLILLIGALFLGCASGRRTPPAEPRNDLTGIDRARYDELATMAEQRLKCSTKRISYEYIGGKVHLLEGCGGSVRYMIFDREESWVKVEAFHDRAAYELRCAVDRLAVERLSGDSWAVSGCGREMIYSLFCREELAGCRWLPTYE